MITRDDMLAGEESHGERWTAIFHAWSLANTPTAERFIFTDPADRDFINSFPTLLTSARIVATHNNYFVCRNHRDQEPGVLGAYYCSHLNEIISNPEFDALFLSNFLKYEMSDLTRTGVQINWRITEDVFRSILLTSVSDRIFNVSIDSHGLASSGNTVIGSIMPEYEGLGVLTSMVIDAYESLTTASMIMCTSTSHWKSKHSGQITLKDKLCLDADKMCYQCAKRAADAMRVATVPGDQDTGFSSLPKSTSPKSAGTTTTGKSFTDMPVYTMTDREFDAMSGGISTTTGSTRINNGELEVFDGTSWTVNLSSFFPDLDNT